MAPKRLPDAEARLPLLPPTTPGTAREPSSSPTRRSSRAGVYEPKPSSVVIREQFHKLLVALTALIVLLLALDAFWNSSPSPLGSGITAAAFEEGLRTCAATAAQRRDWDRVFLEGGKPPSNSRPNGNPRHAVLSALNGSSTPLLIQHATLWDGLGNRLQNTDIALAHGIIVKIGAGLTPGDVVNAANAHANKLAKSLRGPKVAFISAQDVEVVDVQGRVVSPGLVDMHSHSGIGSLPGFWGDEDGNEMAGGPTNPYLRAQDAINPLDKAIELIASGGVTTSLIIPGSGTLMGGEGLAIKNFKSASNSVNDLALNSGMSLDGEDGKLWRWMKMACGENPKRAFGGQGKFPGSRMGNAWAMRAQFEKARSTLRAQDDWCETAESLKSQFKNKASQYVASRYPDTLSDESLVALMRRDIRLQVHCYQTNDIDMMIRNKHEFDFPIIAFHHATEAYMLADKLAAENISAAIFADHSLYKREGYKHSVRGPQVLAAAGAKFAFKSDHPVLNAQHLIYEAQKAVHYGLDEDLAFAAVTSVPAERLGAGWRIGSLQEGFDADVVVWDRPPLQQGAHPLRVIIDGYTTLKHPLVTSQPPTPLPRTPAVSPILDFPQTQLPAYTVSNISGIYTQENQILKGLITVENGIVTCIGLKCTPKGYLLNLNGGVVIPGLIGAAIPLGLEEISAEESTSDGEAGTQDALDGFVHAKDGLRVGGGGKLLEYAWKSGVLTGVVAGKGAGFAQGVSVAFRTAAERYSDAVLKSDVALHITIGNNAKEGYAKSISSQFAHLRKLLTTPPASPDSPFTDVLAGKIPLVVTTHDPNDISKLITLVSTTAPKVRLVLHGATGAYLVADELAKAGVPVILQPPRCQQESWELRWCKPYGTTRPSVYEILKGAGVKVGFTVREPDQVRSLLFEAGWGTVGEGIGDGKVDAEDAVGVVTWRLADAFGLEETGLGRVLVGKRASFIGLDGGPVGFGYKIQVVGDGALVTTQPVQA
ncbi:hypothetical protein BCR33DRAFT_721390 [Rhizoclosmatium globosum]|uniref:Amidohydrolase-related domain-containing protein n=1 Tax=Rhizoclosmatium globosum TaxID=329046 RepID=A0A1Y2BSQ5_9FUNG|nr:hypothetical protein BCR33DRAFT_721390 [Rhizoclosmatium globosum]|eukprot:ORY37667.1 hypothetical protein BCR33DRAFT_721390 [Rhizoclosmatium globosum]